MVTDNEGVNGALFRDMLDVHSLYAANTWEDTADDEELLAVQWELGQKTRQCRRIMRQGRLQQRETLEQELAEAWNSLAVDRGGRQGFSGVPLHAAMHLRVSKSYKSTHMKVRSTAEDWHVATHGPAAHSPEMRLREKQSVDRAHIERPKLRIRVKHQT